MQIGRLDVSLALRVSSTTHRDGGGHKPAFGGTRAVALTSMMRILLAAGVSILPGPKSVHTAPMHMCPTDGEIFRVWGLDDAIFRVVDHNRDEPNHSPGRGASHI
jgi:hypothetical protein